MMKKYLEEKGWTNMRTLKLCALLVVLAAVVVPAEAVTVPPLPNGTLYLKSRNQDNGTTYVDLGLTPGTTVNLTPADFNTVANPLRVSFKAPGSIGGEDTWGIALTYHIAGGVISNPGVNGSQVDYVGPIIYDNSAGTQDTWLVAVFYGGTDTGISLTGGNGSNGIPAGDFSETIDSTGVKFKLYAVDKANLAAGVDSVGLLPFSAADHTADDTYVGWTDATALTGAVLLLEGESDYFQSTVVVDPSGAVVGSSLDATTAYFDIPENGAGLWNPYFGATDQLLTPTGTPTNLWFQWTLGNSVNGWTVKSDDVGGAVAVVPEPLTMLGMFLGIGSVGGYLRRRNRA
jgi:hypothetical protein